MKTFDLVLNEKTGAYMTMYLSAESKDDGKTIRPLMIVIPGGGYSMTSNGEAEPVAMAYAAAGYSTCVLRYTCKDKGGWPTPLEDYEKCYETIAEHAKEWDIDLEHFAVVGFSAGGHLAACTSTISKYKPKAAILVYPAIDRPVCDMCQPGMPCPSEFVDANTSPAFIVAARDDSVVPVSSSLNYALALEKAGVTFELHIVSYGQHGFSTANTAIRTNEVSSRLPRWVNDSIGWLEEVMGAVTRGGFTKPVILPKVNGNGEESLSSFCTITYLRQQGEKVRPILQPVYDIISAIAAGRGYPEEAFYASVGNIPLKMIMQMVNAPAEQIEALDKALRQIPNR